MPSLRFFQRRVYGKTLVYPSPDCATVVFALTGSRTLSNIQLNALSQLGLTVEEVPDPQRFDLSALSASRV